MPFDIEVIVKKHPPGTLRGKYRNAGSLGGSQVQPITKEANVDTVYAGYMAADANLATFQNDLNVSLASYTAAIV